MSDIVERLRRRPIHDWPPQACDPEAQEAAAEIERLRAERQQWLTKSKQWGREIETLEAQVAWMREAIDEKRARCAELGGLLHEAMEDVKFHLECVLLAENAQDEAVLDDRLYRIRAALGTRADQPSPTEP